MQLHEVVLSLLGLACTGLLSWIGFELRALRGLVSTQGERIARVEAQIEVVRALR
jgi:hypothetical protein